MIDIPNQIKTINDHYRTSALVSRAPDAVSFAIVEDTTGARISRLVKRVAQIHRDDNTPILEELLPIAWFIRKARATEPYPSSYSEYHSLAIDELMTVVGRSLQLVGRETQELLKGLLDEIRLARHTSPLGIHLTEALSSAGASSCTLVVANARVEQTARAWLSEWNLQPRSIQIPTSKDLQPECEAYFIGPPSRVGAKSYLSPSCPKLHYLFPKWIPERELPVALLTQYSTDAIRPSVSIRYVAAQAPADDTESPAPLESHDEATHEPWDTFEWPTHPPRTGNPLDDEVLARQLLLAGGRSMLLDQDGGWIRALDPEQPAGERVYKQDEKTVVPGTYLILREGSTNSDALYELTMTLLGDRRSLVEGKQAEWKGALERTIRRHGIQQVTRQLSRAGVETASRARAWVEPTLARPQSAADFRRLLLWLGFTDPETYMANADRYSRARYGAVNDVRGALEEALSATDLEQLKAKGIVKLRLATEGFASMIAARVLAVSPTESLVPRSLVRIPEIDRSARWLE